LFSRTTERHPCALALLLAGLLSPVFVPAAGSTPTPALFDAHIHYSEDVWESLPPKQALAMLSAAGIERALVSSTPGGGVERLYRAAPGRVVPFLRPYPTSAHRYSWWQDPAVIDYLRQQLERIPYRGIGEFHVNGEHVRGEVVSGMIRLARERGLALHAHTDREGLQALLEQAPDIPVIWAHAGFDVPVPVLRDLLGRHARLYLELSYREGITDELERLTPGWRSLLTDYSGRCLAGTDTWSPTRWVELAQLASDTRAWLNQLPEEIADRIARGNAASLFPP